MSVNPFRDIRERVFRCNQTDMAKLLGRSQSGYCYLEKKMALPYSDMIKIREAAEKIGADWSDTFFFDGVDY